MDVSPPESFYSFLILFLTFDEDGERRLRNQQRGGRGSKSVTPHFEKVKNKKVIFAFKF